MHAVQIRRVTIEWRRGSGPYVLIPGATIEYPDVLTIPKGKKGKAGAAEAEVVSDMRASDPASWAKDVATGRWRVCVEWAKKNGPCIDVRFVAWHFDTKKMQLMPIKGGASAKRINLSGEQAGWMDGGTVPGSMEAMNVKLLEMLDRKDVRMNEQHAETTKHLSAVGGLLMQNVEMGRTLLMDKQGGGMAQMLDNQANRDWMLNMYKMQMTGEGIDKAIGQLAPIAQTIAEHWAPEGFALDPVSKIAEELLETINDEQREKFKTSELGDVLADLESALKAIVECKDDKDIAAKILTAILPKLEKHMKAIGRLLTGQQRAGLNALIKASGVEGTEET